MCVSHVSIVSRVEKVGDQDGSMPSAAGPNVVFENVIVSSSWHPTATCSFNIHAVTHCATTALSGTGGTHGCLRLLLLGRRRLQRARRILYGGISEPAALYLVGHSRAVPRRRRVHAT